MCSKKGREIGWQGFLRIRHLFKRDPEIDAGVDLSRPPPRPVDYCSDSDEDECFPGEGDPTMCNYCWQVADHSLDMCPGRDVNPLPCPGPNAIQRLPLPVPKNAIQNPVLIYFMLEDTPAAANDLHELFSVYGPVTKVEIPTDEITGQPEKVGYVSFEKVDDAERALNTLKEEGHWVDWLDWFDE